MKHSKLTAGSRTHGRNQRLGNSLISLGPHGGNIYKGYGRKNNFRIYEDKKKIKHDPSRFQYQHLSQKQFEEQEKKLKEVEDAKLKLAILKQQKELKIQKQRAVVARKTAQAKAERRKLRKEKLMESKRKRRIAKKIKKSLNKSKEKDKMELIKKQTHRNNNIWRYLFQEENVSISGDIVIFQRTKKHENGCYSTEFSITKIDARHKKTILRCNQCEKSLILPLYDFMLAYYFAPKVPLK